MVTPAAVSAAVICAFVVVFADTLEADVALTVFAADALTTNGPTPTSEVSARAATPTFRLAVAVRVRDMIAPASESSGASSE